MPIKTHLKIVSNSQVSPNFCLDVHYWSASEGLKKRWSNTKIMSIIIIIFLLSIIIIGVCTAIFTSPTQQLISDQETTPGNDPIVNRGSRRPKMMFDKLSITEVHSSMNTV